MAENVRVVAYELAIFLVPNCKSNVLLVWLLIHRVISILCLLVYCVVVEVNTNKYAGYVIC